MSLSSFIFHLSSFFSLPPSRFIRVGALLILFLLSFSGCRSGWIKETGDISAFSMEAIDGGRATVYVESDIESESKATRYFWGVTHVNRPERTFSDLLSRHAAEKAGLKIASLNDASVLAGPQAPEERLHYLLLEAARDNSDFLLTAEIDSWRQSYVLFFQWARVEFTLTCYSLPDGDLIWRARPTARRLYGTDRQVLLRALNKTFTSLQKAAESAQR